MGLDTTSLGNALRRLREGGLLRSDWPAWRRFREMRARTSHTYDAKAGAQIASTIPAFLEEAEYLYAELQRRLV